MNAAQLRYYILQNGVGAAIVNALLNGGLGWLMVLKQPELAVWGLPSVASDLVATAFGVAFGTALMVSITTRFDFKRGKASAPPLSAALTAWFARAPARHFPAALWLGALGLLVFAPPALVLLRAFPEPVMPGNTFIAAKALFSAFEGALVTPLVALAAVTQCARAASVSAS
jgi:hypothetical protein